MPDAHFYLHHDPNQESLAGLLVDKLRREGAGDPFSCSQVLVRNQGMATWLRQRFARETGLAMQVEFPQPAQFRQRILGDGSVDIEELKWTIYRELPRLPSSPATGAIHRYLGDGRAGSNNALKRYQLAGHLAALYDKYLLYRPDWIRAWNHGERPLQEPHERWQGELWRRLGLSDTDRHWGPALLESGQIDPDGDLPASLHVFGISNFAPIYVHFLYLLSQRLPVHIYWMNPVEGYWGDAPSKRQWIMAKAFDDPEILMAHNPLLASFGRMGREFVHTIYGGDDGNHEVQEQDGARGTGVAAGGSRLAILQECLRQNVPNRATDSADADRSITIHSCHTPMREVEVLKTHLLTLAESQELDAGDVLVLCPDIAAYAPAIEAVFGAEPQAGAPRLPYRISDRAAPLDEPAVGAVLKLFALHRTRFTNREALALLATPAIAGHFELDQDDLGTIKEWLVKNGIRWGFDPAHVREIAPSCEEAPWAWRDGLDRMLLGYAMPQPDNSATLWRGILPFHDIEGDNARVLGGLCAFVDWCAGIRRDLSGDRSIAAWVERTRAWLDRGYDKSPAEQELLRPLLQALETINQQAKFIDEALPSEVFAAHLEGQLGDASSGRGFLTGAITFCEMKPMRAIPARAVCLLGMNHDNFPRRGGEVQFDLTLTDRRAGDRLTRDDDCYSFLEALLSARESLFISYLGRSVKDGKELPPSTAVQTLIDHTPGLAECVERERLHAFDPHYFDANSPICHDHELLAAAQILAASRVGEEPRLQLPPDADYGIDADTVSIDEFVRWFTKTSAQFLRHCLKARRSYLDTPMEEDEPLQIDNLTAWHMKAAALGQAENLAQQVEAWRQQGMVPTGAFGDQAVDAQLGGIADLLTNIPKTKPRETSVTIDGLTIHGNIPNRRNHRPRRRQSTATTHSVDLQLTGQRRQPATSRRAALQLGEKFDNQATPNQRNPLRKRRTKRGASSRIGEVLPLGTPGTAAAFPENRRGLLRRRAER